MTRRGVSLGHLLLMAAVVAVALYGGATLIRTARSMLLKSAMVDATPSLQPSPVDFALRELSFPIISVATSATAIAEGRVAPRLFADLPLSAVYLLPKRFLPILPPKVSKINTQLVAPNASDDAGEIPVDIVSLGIYSLGLPGPFIWVFVFGLAARFTQRTLARLRPAALHAIVSAAFGLLIASSWVYADPVNVLMSGFYLLLGVGITQFLLSPAIIGLLRPRAERGLARRVA
ncbi:MAG: hypothetical protein ACUVX9_03935 [Anaerolineae bacterium]